MFKNKIKHRKWKCFFQSKVLSFHHCPSVMKIRHINSEVELRGPLSGNRKTFLCHFLVVAPAKEKKNTALFFSKHKKMQSLCILQTLYENPSKVFDIQYVL
jgi:hypothetical protein